MKRLPQLRRLFTVADVFILLLIGAAIFAVSHMAQHWQGAYRPAVEIDLSLASLPKYVLFSASRGLAAYVISLTFSLLYGYAAAKSRILEKLLIPLLDILQSIPVLGFLPGLVLGLIAIFPDSNWGIEIAAVLMIFTGQAWNLTFAFYAALRGLPPEYDELAQTAGLNWWRKLRRIELPYASTALAWNSLMSMAGGWFFLTVCEAFTLGDNTFRLPGIGAYMAVAIEQGNNKAIFSGVIAMMILILALDFLIWQPLLVWVQRFRGESSSEGIEADQSLMLALFEESILFQKLQDWVRAFQWSSRSRNDRYGEETPVDVEIGPLRLPRWAARRIRDREFVRRFATIALVIAGLIIAVPALKAVQRLFGILASVSWQYWVLLIRDTFWTTLRVFGALLLASAWAIPVGVWIGLSPKLTRVFQPIIQLAAAFPAPMLYPLILAVLALCNVNLEFGAMVLMMSGAQWYVLFNVLAGAMGVDKDLVAMFDVLGVKGLARWKRLYLPAIFPSLIVGWVTAAGGAWNSCIITEYIRYKSQLMRANGVGALISEAAAAGEIPQLAAGLLVIVLVVIAFNRALWHPLTNYAERRFRA